MDPGLGCHRGHTLAILVAKSRLSTCLGTLHHVYLGTSTANHLHKMSTGAFCFSTSRAIYQNSPSSRGEHLRCSEQKIQKSSTQILQSDWLMTSLWHRFWSQSIDRFFLTVIFASFGLFGTAPSWQAKKYANLAMWEDSVFQGHLESTGIQLC